MRIKSAEQVLWLTSRQASYINIRQTLFTNDPLDRILSIDNELAAQYILEIIYKPYR